MYLLDTNHCSNIILGNTFILNYLADIDNALVATCVVVQGELVDMAERSQRKENNLALIERFLKGLYIYHIDETTASIYGQLKALLFNKFAPKERNKRRKTKMLDLGFDENDLWLAAIALQHNLTIVSADSDFLRMQPAKQLSVESWL